MVKYKLGQHFLTDQSVINKEIAFAELSSDDVVLEIGPGKGVLTQELAKRVRKVIAVELDHRLIKYLKQEIQSNVILIHKDVIDISWDELPSFTKVVANLPFQISSPFTFKLFETVFEKAVMIYQKEFAERMIAQPGSKSYSRLSVGVAYKAKCQIRLTIPPHSFSPPPEVFSSLVELVPYKTPPFHVIDESFFFKITTLLFSHRRKKIGTILKNSFSESITKDVMFSSERVETLTPEEIGLLSNKLYPFRHYLKKQ